MGIDLTRDIVCPHCGERNRIDLVDYCYESSVSERQMGPEVIYCIDTDKLICRFCKKAFTVTGDINEYPEDALNFERLEVEPL